ncbi:hypothetical protein GGE16_001800 [Rhizobium leguminosarum]|uniref:Uncharacterized protein n=1 Tax=Rhizobium leguminosarum TaxID=384 RepID=A0AAE2MI95_RHILE|nr:hypothetical protein [Rhizobium leguminosarum]MBB4296403.1 hypothetical protein [Rhizobium leguminosarum]MBB4308336.1 hypothetical protein [Rhizobium leguminosarum]MBB4529494.1 hypothetical protein [Rhizobium leguminosarum]MBB5651084.1 hypothetical protein [Rhizobium leguminosarum]
MLKLNPPVSGSVADSKPLNSKLLKLTLSAGTTGVSLMSVGACLSGPSLAPVMATTMLWLAVPSSELTLSVSLTASPWLSACVAARLLSSV